MERELNMALVYGPAFCRKSERERERDRGTEILYEWLGDIRLVRIVRCRMHNMH